MSKGIEILCSTLVSLPPLPQTPPPIKLSFFDCFWVGLPPVQKLLVYSNPSTHLSFPSLLQILKSSLSSTLLDFLPLVGKLTYIPSTGDVEIDLSDPSYIFVEAESDLDLHQLATNEVHDVESFSTLVPVIDTSMLPFRVLAVQVTRFNCGGMTIGYSIHHAVADGKASNQFIERWTSVCKAKMDNADLPIECRRLPLYDRAVIKNPKGEEIAREFLRSIVPTLPNTNANVITSVVRERHLLSRRTFLLNAPSILLLKQRCTGHETNNSTPLHASTFTAISVYVWACIARSKSLDPEDQTVFCFLMDCRSLLSPPIHEVFLGNCVRPVYAKLLVSELIEKDGLVRGCTTIQKLLDVVTKDPFGDCESWAVNILIEFPFERTVNVAGSPKFRVYESDFGWGKPDRFELVSMNRDGEFALVGGKEAGSVQVTVALNPTQMETFSKFFLGGLSGYNVD